MVAGLHAWDRVRFGATVAFRLCHKHSVGLRLPVIGAKCRIIDVAYAQRSRGQSDDANLLDRSAGSENRGAAVVADLSGKRHRIRECGRSGGGPDGSQNSGVLRETGKRHVCAIWNESECHAGWRARPSDIRTFRAAAYVD